MRFGFFLWIGSIATFIVFQYNDWIIGTYLSTATLGFYAKALQFAQLPTSLVTSLVSKVALPTYSKLQSDPQKLSTAFNFVLRSIIRFSVPISLVIFLLSPELVRVLIGEKWLPMVPILRIFIVYSLLRPVFDDTGALITAIGKPKIVSNYLLIQGLLLVVLSPILTYLFKENGAAVALNLVVFVGVLLAYRFIKKNIEIDFKKLILPPLISTVGAIIFYYLATTYFLPPNLNQWVSIFLKLVLISIVYLTITILMDRNGLKEDWKFIKTVISSTEG